MPNPDGKDHRPPATFARERKGTFRANRTDLPNPGGTGTDPERRNTTTKRKKKRKKTKNKKERHKKKEQRQEEKKPTPTQETQQEQEHSNTTPKPKPKHKKKHDARLAPGCAETAVNGGFPTKLSIVRGVLIPISACVEVVACGRSMEKEPRQVPPSCVVCGKPVEEKYLRSNRNGKAGDYRICHITCNKRYEHMLNEQRRRRAERELDEALAHWWMMRDESLRQLRIAIEDYNEETALHDPLVVRLVYEKCRQAILAMHIDPLTVIRYRDEWFRRLAADIGRDGMNRIADMLGWDGARGWNQDPDVSAEGRTIRVTGGRIDVPGEQMEDEFTDDLNLPGTLDARTVDWKRTMDHIWREDNIGSKKDRGPWRYR